MISTRRAQVDDFASVLRIERKSFGEDAWDWTLFLDYLAQSGQ
jgi:hypothetical protein